MCILLFTTNVFFRNAVVDEFCFQKVVRDLKQRNEKPTLANIGLDITIKEEMFSI